MKCPWCQQKINHEISSLFGLSRRRKEIFNVILNGGPNGVPLKDLQDRFNIKSPITARSTIHYINTAIHPLRIRSRGRYFRVERVTGRNTAG